MKLRFYLLFSNSSRWNYHYHWSKSKSLCEWCWGDQSWWKWRINGKLPDYPLKVRVAAASIYSFQSKESKIIICGGGYPTTNKCFLFNPSTFNWEETKPMKTKRQYHSMATRHDGTIISCGGRDASYNRLKSCEKYDGNWEVIAPLPTPLDSSCMVSINGATFLIGGYPSSGVVRELWCEY